MGEVVRISGSFRHLSDVQTIPLYHSLLVFQLQSPGKASLDSTLSYPMHGPLLHVFPRFTMSLSS